MIDHSSEEYRASVERSLTGVDEGLVFNGTIDHARVVVEEAFKAAKAHVRILSNHLDSECYDAEPVVAAATAFVARADTKLDILVEAPSDMAPQPAFLRAVQAAGGTRVRFRIVPKEYLSTYTFNFLTVDDTAFRFEDDRAKPIGVVAGGAENGKIARHLVTVFDGLFSRSQPQELQLTPA